MVMTSRDSAPPTEVLDAFCPEGESYLAVPLGGGNINETYLLHGPNGKMVLQRIAEHVFSDPRVVIENFVEVSSHLRRRADVERVDFVVAAPVPAVNGSLAIRDKQGGWWRGQSYLEHGAVRISDLAAAKDIGRILALFHHLASGLEKQIRRDPLPDFHDLEKYLRQFDEAWLERSSVRDDEAAYCLAIIARMRTNVPFFRRAVEQGILVAQPVHGDPKLENFIGTADSGRACGLFDLDTVRVGLVHHDLGDCLRSCCNVGGEEGGGRVRFDGEVCRAIISGYFSQPYSGWTQGQRELIYDGLLLICFELGLRFFTDYLAGNSYFKVADSRQNLRRALRQFSLVENLVQRERELRKMIVAASSN